MDAIALLAGSNDYQITCHYLVLLQAGCAVGREQHAERPAVVARHTAQAHPA
jgi:hypothetical protein